MKPIIFSMFLLVGVPSVGLAANTRPLSQSDQPIRWADIEAVVSKETWKLETSPDAAPFWDKQKKVLCILKGKVPVFDFRPSGLHYALTEPMTCTERVDGVGEITIRVEGFVSFSHNDPMRAHLPPNPTIPKEDFKSFSASYGITKSGDLHPGLPNSRFFNSVATRDLGLKNIVLLSPYSDPPEGVRSYESFSAAIEITDADQK